MTGAFGTVEPGLVTTTLGQKELRCGCVGMEWEGGQGSGWVMLHLLEATIPASLLTHVFLVGIGVPGQTGSPLPLLLLRPHFPFLLLSPCRCCSPVRPHTASTTPPPMVLCSLASVRLPVSSRCTETSSSRVPEGVLTAKCVP